MRRTRRVRRTPRPLRTERHRSRPGRSSSNSRWVEQTDRRANLHQLVRHVHHVSNTVLDRHPQLTSNLAHIDPSTVLDGRQLIHTASIGRPCQTRLRSVTKPPLASTSLWGSMLNTSCQVPAAAQTASYWSRSGSMSTRSGVFDPNGDTPPLVCSLLHE